MVEKKYNLKTGEIFINNIKIENVSRDVWGCCHKMQQRYVFIFISTLGSMLHAIMGISMSTAIVAMVKTHQTSNSSDVNITSVLHVCPVKMEDEMSDSVSPTQGGEFDWDEMTQGYVLIASSLGSLASGLVGARIAELWSPKLLYGILNVFGGVLNLLIPAAARLHVSALIALKVIQGIFHGPGSAIHNILISNWIPPEERTKLGGIYLSGTAFGTIISMLLSGVLISAFSWDSVFYIYGVVTLVWLIFWFLFIYDSPITHPGISDEEKKYILSNVPKDIEVVYPVPWIKILTSPPIWAHIAMQSGNMWVMYILLTELPTYLNNILHYDTKKTGYVSALPMVSTLIACILFATLSQWLRRHEYLTHMMAYRVFNGITTLGPAAALVAITQMGCDSFSIVVLLIITSGLNAAFIGGSVYNLLDLGINFTGTTSGIAWMATQVVTILTPIITSSIINNNQTVSTWSLVFFISAVVAVIPYIIFLFFGSVEEQHWNKPITKSDENSTPTKIKDIENIN